MLKLRTTSSLEKVFLDSLITEYPLQESEKIFSNQIFAYQIVYSCDVDDDFLLEPVVESDIAACVTVREVGNVPVEFPVRPDDDERVRTTVGLYPDILRPLSYGGRVRVWHGQTRSLWVEVAPQNGVCGKHDITVSFFGAEMGENGLERTADLFGSCTFSVNIDKAEIPEQTTMFTQWFYADCLAQYYHVPVFSDRHFEICENFIRAGIRAGRTMVLMPLLTPALDTAVGGERLTTQLVKIQKDGDRYTFDFSLVGRWVEICRRTGVKQYEISHFFTQWGAYHAPKVVATVNGKEKQIFGWKTDAISAEYVSFLRQLIQSFLAYMTELGENEKCWFHISDEPQTEHLEQYKKCKGAIGDLLAGYHVMDALSHYEYYEQGIVQNPVPSTEFIVPFLEHNVPDLWCYYCGGVRRGTSNCHIAMSLARTRFLGVQMFKYNIAGFLNWGYNFYYNKWSYDCVDPFGCTDAMGFEHAGDPFMVYPGTNGQPWESLRMRALYEAFEDIRVFRLAETLYSHEFVVAELEKICGTIVFDRCVNDAETMLKLRRRINELIFKTKI